MGPRLRDVIGASLLTLALVAAIVYIVAAAIGAPQS